MFRSSALCLRTPMIKFTHGHNATRSVAAPAVAAAAQPLSVRSVDPNALNSVFDLPPHMRPTPMSEEEMTAIRFGGCSDYDLSPKKAAPGKNGAVKKAASKK